MSGGEIAALIAAAAFLLLVGFLAVPILKLGNTVDAATRSINEITDKAVPILASAHVTVDRVNGTLDGVSHQLDKLDTVTSHVSTLTGNVSGLSSLFTATLGGPLIRVAALTYGVRSAINARRRADVEREVKATMKARKRGRRSAA